MVKKKKLTKEEKEALKQFKTEEVAQKMDRVKRRLRKEHIMLIVASIALVAMVIGLIYLIFFSKKYEVIVPDLPTYENISVGMVDFKDEASNDKDLNTKKVKELNVNYSIVSDYYKNGITLSNTQVDYVNSSLLITSGRLSKEAFVSKVSLEGKLLWLTKIQEKNYDSIALYTTKFINDNYLAYTISEKNNKKDLVVYQISNNGKLLTYRVIASDISGKIYDVIIEENKIGVIIQSNNSITIYYTNESLDAIGNVYDLKTNNNELSGATYLSSTLDNGVSKLIVNKNNTHYLVTINEDGTSNSKELESIDNIKSESTINASDYLKGFIFYSSDNVYKLNPYNELLNKIDYSKIKLEDDEKYKEKYKDDELIDISEMSNRIYIEKVNVFDGKIIVKANTLYSSIYDIYDSNLSISKRYIFNNLDYSYDDGILLNSFFINDEIYEIYSYGTETPSIMINRIG